MKKNNSRRQDVIKTYCSHCGSAFSALKFEKGKYVLTCPYCAAKNLITIDKDGKISSETIR